MEPKEFGHDKDAVYYEWQIDWLLSDAPRTPSESAAKVQKIAAQSGKSIAEASLVLINDLNALSSRRQKNEKRISR